MSANKNHFAIILAGGRGERFWPLSREATPKQFLTLLDGKKSFLQRTYDRIKPAVPPKNIYIITSESQAAGVRKQLPKLPKDNVIAEPCGRNTCPAVTLATALVGARSTTGVMAILPSDHIIPAKHEKKYQKILEESFDLCGRGQAIATIGIKPTKPETGYGYIRVGDTLPPPAGRKAYKTAFYRAERFVEKPNYHRALDYLQDGGYRWNAGMFIFSFATMAESLIKHQKALAEKCEQWMKVAGTPAKLKKALKKDYPDLKSLSFDYGVMEHAQNVLVADGDFDWDDLGNWTSLENHIKADAEGNCVDADFVHVDAARNIIFDTRKKKDRRPIAVAGLRDCIVVATDDTLMIAHKHAAQKVRELYQKIAADKAFKHLA
ncbi:MAG: mannose-1-phosphate guanylyltransferase [Verrucomicrobiota bacterium]|nr:mannose-1-phosphate guanylyltransferase [Verrucomicrobiota bacterium]